LILTVVPDLGILMKGKEVDGNSIRIFASKAGKSDIGMRTLVDVSNLKNA